MTEESVSIIVPVYNVPEKMLRKCLSNLLSQNYTNYEIIVVNDGSTDDSGKICEEYSNNNNLIVYHKENGGLCNARNYGVNKAKNKWITFVDGDDYLDENIFAKVLKGRVENTEVICFGTIKKYKNKQFFYEYDNAFIDGKVYADKEYLLEKLLDFNSNIGDVTAKFYNREFLVKNDLYHNEDIKQGVEAIDFNFKVFEKLNKLKFIKEYGYFYEFNDQSITMTIDEKSLKLILKGIEELNLNVKKSPYVQKLSIKLDERIKYVIVTTLISGIFSPDNKINKREKKKLYKLLMKDKNVERVLSNKNTKIDKKREFVLFLAKNGCINSLKILGLIRKKMKEN